MTEVQFSDRQKRIATTAVTILSLVVILAALGALFWLAARFLGAFSHVFLPLAVAGVAALVFQPYFDWLRKRLRLPSALALVVLVLSILLPFLAFLAFFGVILAQQVGELADKVPDWWNHLLETGRERWPQVTGFLNEHPMGQRIRGIIEGQNEAILDGLQFFGVKALSAGRGVVRGIGSVFSWAVTPVYFVFILMAKRKDLGRLDAALPFLKPETRESVVFLVREFVTIVVAFFRGQLIIAFLQGVLLAIGFTAVGLKFGLVLGLLLGFLNIIPYLGSIVGLAICLPLAYFQDGGGLWTLGAVVVVFAAVQAIEGYILTPKIMGDRTGLHPMAIIVAVFFWGAALGGILGMILAIPLTAFLVVFWRLARDKYIEEWV